MKKIILSLTALFLCSNFCLAQGESKKTSKNDWIESNLKGKVKSIKVNIKYDASDRNGDKGFIEIGFNDMGYIIETSQDNYWSDFSGARRFKYDNNQNIIEAKEFSLGGELFSTTTSNYDQDGNKTEENLYDGNKLIERVVYVNDGSSIVKKRYNNNELSDIATLTYDLMGNLIEKSFKYATIEGGSKSYFRYDEMDNLIEELNHDNNGSQISKYVYRYDKMRRVNEQIDYERSGIPVGRTTFKYNVNGDKIEMNRYNANGKLETRTISTFVYDKNSNWIKQSDSENGKPAAVIERKITYLVAGGDKDKSRFIGRFTWNGGCARGCFYTHIFNRDGTVKTTFETAISSETNTEKWTIDESSKIITIGKEKYYYEFKNGNIILTSYQYPSEIQELNRE